MLRRRAILLVASLLILILGLGIGALPQTDEELLRRADRARFLEADSYTLTIKVTVERPGEEPDQARLQVFSKRFVGDGDSENGSYRVRIEFLEPEALRGMVYLVVGDEIYFWKPGLIQPLRVSGQQRLFGDASVIEAAGIRFTSYEIVSREPDTLEGQEVLRLELEAKAEAEAKGEGEGEARGPVAYQQVTLWVDLDFKPKQAVLRSLGGQPLKRVLYRRYAEHEGDELVVEQVIENLLFEEYRTVITVEEVSLEELPDELFDPEAL